MRGIFTIFLRALITTSLVALVRTEYNVTQVQVVFRHGERTPRKAEMYPNDIHGVSAYEPWGLSQLTNAGKVREYKLGQVLKTRYQNFLSSLNLPNDVYAVSTDVDRTKMSLQLVLAGLFPPSEAQTWNPELPWIPIPSHYVPRPIDIVMKSHLCPEFQDSLSQIRQTPEVEAKIAVHDDLFQFLTVNTGLNLTASDQVYEVYNLLVAQKAMNLTLPEWCTDAVFAQMAKVTILEYQIRSYTTELRRLNGGPMVRKFIENMRLDGAREHPRKIYLYSGHEVTISAFLQAQGILEPKLPLYGGAVMLEKLRDANGKLFVRLVLWTGVTEQLMTLRLPGCDEICPIEKYLHLTREVIPSNEEMDCHWRRLSPSELRDIFTEKIDYD